MSSSEKNWAEQKLCTDVGEYELVVEMQTRDWQCEQDSHSWKWMVIYHGSVIASGSVADMETAQAMAKKNVPESAEEKSSDCAHCSDD